MRFNPVKGSATELGNLRGTVGADMVRRHRPPPPEPYLGWTRRYWMLGRMGGGAGGTEVTPANTYSRYQLLGLWRGRVWVALSVHQQVNQRYPHIVPKGRARTRTCTRERGSVRLRPQPWLSPAKVLSPWVSPNWPVLVSSRLRLSLRGWVLIGCSLSVGQHYLTVPSPRVRPNRPVPVDPPKRRSGSSRRPASSGT